MTLSLIENSALRKRLVGLIDVLMRNLLGMFLKTYTDYNRIYHERGF